MKKFDYRILLCLLSLLFIGAFPVVCAAQDVVGTYSLYNTDNKLVGSMSVTSQNGSNFTIGGSGWSGSGSVSNGSGYYDWRFTDGRSGRTTIRATAADGIIEGTVQGPNGDATLNWTYTAKRTSRPQTSCATISNPIKDSNLDQFYVVIDNSCSYAIQVTVRNDGVDYGMYVPAGQKGQRLTVSRIGGSIAQDYRASWKRAAGS
jgi:hypothetical protein